MTVMTDYDLLDGHIRGVFCGNSVEQIVMQLLPGRGIIEGSYDGETHYILDETPTNRPAQSTTLDGLILTGLPVPSVLWIEHDSYDVTDTDPVELEFPLPGTYRLRVEAFPHLDWTGEVTV